ncbi:hypothetical protein AURDEDRAFT_160285 [Auricularia subglabra TFB-10046 SS5]|nr:hypothetical protein AURDEDRAFT_160285 [Auricularia subglabra TFB-10046 SS5]
MPGAVAVATIVAYEYVLTIDQEADYIYHWKGGWSLPSFLFLLNRYFIFVVLIMSNLTLLWPDPPESLWVVVYPREHCVNGGLQLHARVNLSLTIRLYAFWHRSKAILIFLLVLLTLCDTSSIITNVMSFEGVKVIPKFAPGVPSGCFLIPPTQTWASLIPVLVFDTVVMLLTLIQARRLLHGAGPMTQRQTPIVDHLLRTGVGYYIVIFGTTAFVTISALASPHLAAIVPSSGVLAALTSIMCSRLLLYIRSELKEAKTPRLASGAAWPPYASNLFEMNDRPPHSPDADYPLRAPLHEMSTGIHFHSDRSVVSAA